MLIADVNELLGESRLTTVHGLSGTQESPATLEQGHPVPEAGTRSTRWYLASQASSDGPRYAVYVDGHLITSGHRTGAGALAEAQRLLGEESQPERTEPAA